MQKSPKSDLEASPERRPSGGVEIGLEPANLLKPRSELYRQSKAEETTRAAREIIAAEVAAREKQRERLRAARLAKEAADGPKPAKPARGRRR